MNPKRAIFLLFLLLLATSAAWSQTGDVGPIRSSAAYAEVLLRRTQLQADLEAFSADYTEANPKIIDLRNELAALTKSGSAIKRRHGLPRAGNGRGSKYSQIQKY